jgi:outer membrane protein assembly factor BamB
MRAFRPTAIGQSLRKRKPENLIVKTQQTRRHTKSSPREVFTLLTGCLLLGMMLAASWPQWRGPQRDGISNETGLLKEWPAEGPRMLWQIDGLGDGFSTPAVVGERIYLISNKGLENEFVQALDAKDGRQIWEKRIGNVGQPDQQPSYPSARSTPTYDGGWLYALGSAGDLVCIDSKSGDVRWQKNLQTDFSGKPGEWAYSESPLVDGDTVVVTPGGKEATLVALNKNTGDVIWQAQVPQGDEAAYASIVILEAGGVKQYVQFLAKGVVGIDADTGKFLWRYDNTATNSPANIGTPVVNAGCVYSGSHYAGGGLIKINGTPEGFVVEEKYFDKKLPTAIGGAVLVDGYLYGTNRTTMTCTDFKTGEIKWTEERGLAPASLCYADGMLFVHGENSGEVGLVEATPEEYRERGKFMPPGVPEKGRSKAWTYPAVADGRLYLHDWGTLWCYDVKAAAAGN